MDNYLKTTLDKLRNNNYAELNIVIGNESCDLDSAVSAVVYAAFLDWHYDKIKCCKVCTRFNRDETTYKDDIYIPILNVSRQDYPLKTEVVHCFKKAGITKDDLVFRDDYDLNELIKNTTTKVIMVDHHTLSNNDQLLTPFVIEIVDHRPLDKSQWGFKDDTRSTIETVGSCCTLIAQRIKDLSTLVAKQDDFFKSFPVCADLLYSTIILDTVNCSKEVDKATPHDVEVVTYLETLLNPKDIVAERLSRIDALVKARSDVSDLDAYQLLRKDVKIFGDVLVPSFPILVKSFLKRPKVLKVISETLTMQGCSVALLLGMDLSEGLKRDTAVWSPNPARGQRLCDLLQSWEPSLELSPVELRTSPDNPLADLKYFNQINLKASRKQYIPAVTKFLKK